MEAEPFVCKKLRAVNRAGQETPQQNENNPAVAQEGESTEQLPEPNGNDATVEVGESSERIDEQNGTDGAVKPGEESRKKPVKRIRSITPVELEVELMEQPSQQNGNDPAVKQGKISKKEPAKQNGTDGAVRGQESRENPVKPNGIGTPIKKQEELRKQLPEQKKGKPVLQGDGSIRYHRPYVTSDRRNDIVDLHTLSDGLWCVECDLPISLMNITGVKVNGLVRIYEVHCQICDKVCEVPTSGHCRDYVSQASTSVANGSDSSATPSTSQGIGSNSVANGSGTFVVPSTSQGIGSNSVANDSGLFVVPSTSQGIGSNSVEREYDRVIMTSPLKLKLIRSPAKQASTAPTTGPASTSKASTSATETSTEAPKVENKVEGVYLRVEGRHIINLGWLATKLWCENCRLPLSLRHVLKYHVEGLVVIFRVHCRKCRAEVVAETSSKKDNKKLYEINELALLGIKDHEKEVMDKVFESMKLLPIPPELELFETSHQENEETPRPVEAGEENVVNPRPKEAREENVVTLESDDDSSD
ncbi:uncharacterized protein LOC106655433 isoform X3 [Trichogramma pretiosum]|uniref:uncharacterized protein LOC106655433 isoform X3 n=1 Tax=Trichogramma pretiosum TaxID=7493 RepID=UPI0006C9A818|nr:uncharacterized protein LOC106655433 isoform X3 [Trichogramma pretiosum]